MLGKLELPLRKNRFYTVFGGPYRDRPRFMTVGVKLAKEIKAPHEIDCPIVDFSVPSLVDLDPALEMAVQCIIDHMPVYVGCMGGRGRTGLFLAILAKAFGVPLPVEYVREHYFEHAVETQEQYDFVDTYQIPAPVRIMLRWAWLRSFFTRRKSLTNIPVELTEVVL